MDNLHPVLIKIKVIASVNSRTQTEKILSLNNIVQTLVSHSVKITQVGDKVSGVMTELIPIIPKILKISDPITFPTPISYLFFIIAATVAAISGKLVPAATIVAPIAHSEIQKL